MKKENEVFAKNLNNYLNECKMTRQELADKLNVGKTSIHFWCTGEKLPRINKIDDMCKIFHCRRSDLLEDELTKDTIIRASKSSELYLIIEQLNDTGMERLLAYAKELSKLYGGEDGLKEDIEQ